MLPNLFYLTLFIRFIIIFQFFKSIICSNNHLWSYEKCKKYLDSLNIICNSISKTKNGKELCKSWKINNLMDINFIPKECQNKQYSLKLSVTNSIMNDKENSNTKNKKEYLIDLSNIKHNNLVKEKELFPKCLNIFQKYNKMCELSSKDKKINNFCNDLKKKNITKLCNDLINNIENNVNDLIGKKYSNINQKKLNINFEILENLGDIEIEKITENANDDFIEEEKNIFLKDEDKKIYDDNNTKNKIVKSYFEIDKEYDENYDNDEELENGFNLDGKDCVEYGLKSIDEDILICTKYE